MSMTMISTSAPRAVVTGGDPAVMADPNASVVSTDRKVMGAPDEGVVQRSGSVPIQLRTEVGPGGLQWVPPGDAMAFYQLMKQMTYSKEHIANNETISFFVLFVGATGEQPSIAWYTTAMAQGRVMLVQFDTIGTTQMIIHATRNPEFLAEKAQAGGPLAIMDLAEDPVGPAVKVVSDAQKLLAGEPILDDEPPPPNGKEIAEDRTKDVPIVQAATEPGLPSWVLPAAIGVTGAGVLYWLMTRRRSE